MTDRNNINNLATDLFNNFEDRCKGLHVQRNRIVAIVGAGASVAAGFPLGAQLKQDLFRAITDPVSGLLTKKGALLECCHFWRRKDFDFADPCPQQFNDANLKSIHVADLEALIIDKNQFDFLAFCQALSGFRGVRSFIDEYIIKTLRHDLPHPVLTYELLSHLLHHRFLDHIVSMNFDTLLDDSLQDELGRDAINMVLSDRDIPSLRSTVRGEEGKPWYVKPHGSVTLPDSLRFTLTQTSGLSRSMMELLRHVLFGTSNASDSEKSQHSWSNRFNDGEQLRLILLFIGWACRERTFRRMLSDRAASIDKIYWFHRPTPGSNELDLGPAFRHKILGISCPPGNGRLSGLDEKLLNVYSKMPSSRLPQSVHLPPISRHLLYCYALGSESGKNTSKLRNAQDIALVTSDRLRFELFYYSLKSKGSFSTHNISQISRIQNSFNRFKELESHSQTGLNWSIDRDVVEDCFEGQITKEHLREAYALETYRYEKPGSDGISNSLKRLLDYFWAKKNQLGNTAPGTPTDACVGLLSFRYQRHQQSIFSEKVKQYLQLHGCRETWEQTLAELLAHHLDVTRCMPEVEIDNHPSSELTWLFRKPKRICSIAELEYRTYELLNDDDWDTLKIITEAGSWLLADDIRRCLNRRGSHLHVIISADDVPLSAGHLNDLRKAFPLAKIDTLPWWLHNRHMTLSVDTRRQKNEFRRGLYFRRRLKTGLISPVELCTPEDLETMNNLFIRYVDKHRDWENKNLANLPLPRSHRPHAGPARAFRRP